MGLWHACVIGTGLALATACAEPLATLTRHPSGRWLPRIFWPPSGATSVCTGEPAGETFGDVAAGVAATLHGAGYDEVRWSPVGIRFAHGFAVTTRLEQIDARGAPGREDVRFSSLYPDAASLSWLEDARTPRVPGRGRFRAFLLVFTDLPIGPTHVAPAWDMGTLMEAPDMPEVPLPAARPVTGAFRLGAYVYEYSATDDRQGRLVADGEGLPALEHLRNAGLFGLVRR